MKNRSGEKIKMPTLDELMGISGEENANELEINRIHNFANHPFKVVDDEEMDELVESIEKNGILVAFCGWTKRTNVSVSAQGTSHCFLKTSVLQRSIT